MYYSNANRTGECPTKTVYICERRRFATLADASAFANKYFARWGIVVAITAKQVRK